MLSDLDIAKVRELWGAREYWRDTKSHWTSHPIVYQRLNLLVSGDPRKDRFQYFIDRYYRHDRPQRQVKRILTLGCGAGAFERGLSQYKFAKIHEAIDISDQAVAEAAKLARAENLEGIRYKVGDLNNIELPPLTYDVVFGISSIHHVLNLEQLFHQVALSLKPGGYFFLDEYIGPTRFQWPDGQLAIINEQIAALPPEFKRSISNGSVKGSIGRVSVEELYAIDPSEAVRSAEILKMLPFYFDIVEIKGCGGSLLHPLLEGIAGNFAEDDPRAMKHLQSLFELEDQLIGSGRLQHDFAVIIARRKPTRVQKVLGPKVAYVVSKTRSVLQQKKGERASKP